MNKNAMITSEIKPRNYAGIYQVRIGVFDFVNKVWVAKLNPKGELGTKIILSEDGVITDILDAFIDAGMPASGKWIEVSSSGIMIEGYIE